MSIDNKDIAKSSGSDISSSRKAEKRKKYLGLYEQAKDIALKTYPIPQDQEALKTKEQEHLGRLLAKQIGALLIGQEKNHEQEIENAVKAGQVDPLTGLPNRARFTQEVVEELANFRRQAYEGQQRSSTVLFIDANGLKKINDNDPTHHQKGDDYLIRIGLALSETIRPQDVVARIGGDEFGVLLRGMDILDMRELWDQRLLRALVNSDVSVSIGAAPFDPDNLDQTLSNADSSMYQAKEEARTGGTNVLRIYGENIR